MGLDTDIEVKHYLNARRTFSRNRSSLEQELEDYRTALEKVLSTIPEIKHFLTEEERVVYGRQLEELQRNGVNMGKIGYALYFHKTLQPLNEHQKEVRDDMGMLYTNQYYIAVGMAKIRNEEKMMAQTRLGCMATHDSESEVEKRTDKLITNFQDKSIITETDAEYLEYYRKRMEYSRYVFAGIEPYEELFGNPEVHLPFYRGVSSFMLSIIGSIKETEQAVKSHLGRWNM